jgi:hypothetical protein
LASRYLTSKTASSLNMRPPAAIRCALLIFSRPTVFIWSVFRLYVSGGIICGSILKIEYGYQRDVLDALDQFDPVASLHSSESLTSDSSISQIRIENTCLENGSVGYERQAFTSSYGDPPSVVISWRTRIRLTSKIGSTGE